MLCILENIVYGLDLAFHKVTEHLVIREILGDKSGGSVSTVSCSESVVDIAVSVRSESLHEFLLRSLDCIFGSFLLLIRSILGKSARFALLLCIVTEVLKEKNFARFEGGCLLLSLLAVLGELNRNTEKFAYVCKDMLEREFRIHFFRASEVGHYDERTAACKNLLECRKGSADTGIVRYLEIFVKRNVEVHANDGFFAFKIVRINKLLHNFYN